jgi:hypothetical protein
MEEQILTAFLFLKVRARRSGRVVELLRESYEEIKEAAAVYAETDVIARATATESRMGSLLLELMQGELQVRNEAHETTDAFQVDSIQPLLVLGKILEGQDQYDQNQPGDIYAYVIIEIDEKQETRSQVLQELHRCNGIIYTAGLATRGRAIAKVKAPNKVAFDNNIMQQIQSISGVATTRSLLIINDMHFTRLDKAGISETSIHNVASWAGKKNSRRG